MISHQRTSLADLVFQQLEEGILSGRFKDGEVLTELAISGKLNVSRTPVREAIRRLQQEGYLEDSGKGSVVVGTSAEDMADIFEMRLRLEGLAARWATARITPEGLAEIREVVELQEFYTARREAGRQRLQEMDDTFHRLIFRCCLSPALEGTLLNLHRRLQQYRRKSLSDPERADRVVREHRAIFEAMARGDADEAERLTLEHIEKAKENITEKEKSWD